MQNLLDIPLNMRNTVGNSWKQHFEIFTNLLSPCKILQERLQNGLILMQGKSEEIYRRFGLENEFRYIKTFKEVLQKLAFQTSVEHWKRKTFISKRDTYRSDMKIRKWTRYIETYHKYVIVSLLRWRETTLIINRTKQSWKSNYSSIWSTARQQKTLPNSICDAHDPLTRSERGRSLQFSRSVIKLKKYDGLLVLRTVQLELIWQNLSETFHIFHPKFKRKRLHFKAYFLQFKDML